MQEKKNKNKIVAFSFLVYYQIAVICNEILVESNCELRFQCYAHTWLGAIMHRCEYQNAWFEYTHTYTSISEPNSWNLIFADIWSYYAIAKKVFPMNIKLFGVLITFFAISIKPFEILIIFVGVLLDYIRSSTTISPLVSHHLMLISGVLLPKLHILLNDTFD